MVQVLNWQASPDMSQVNARRQYAERIDKVVDYIVSHLDQPLPLERLADIGHFSPWHFHRIYRGMMGETVQATVQRMRLHRAANELALGHRTLDAIARDAGYSSQAAFSRAFSPVYGLPPGRFRERSVLPSLNSSATHRSSDLSETYSAAMQCLNAVSVAALRHQGDYQRIGDIFQRLAVWGAGQGMVPNGARSFGIYHNDPESVEVDALVSYACIEIPQTLEPQSPISAHKIPAGRYAVMVHTGPYSELEHAYRWLYGAWLPGSGEEAADQPVVEEYLNDCQSLPPTQWRTAICLPLHQEAQR